jgi:branched-chain amino acid transport system ATP-binding protein
MADLLIEARGLNTYYGASHVLRDVDFRVARGEAVGLMGRNGMGKTTLIKSLLGLLPVRAGEILINGKAMRNAPPYRIARAGIGYVPEGRGIFARMSITENLQMGAFIRQDDEIGSDMERVFELFARLKERRSQLAGTLSGGEQQMLAIGRALMARPKVLLLDEPSMGLAPLMVDKIFEVVADIHRQGVTVVLVEQNARRALQLASRAYVMESGRITLSGAASDLLDDPLVRQAYLGA